MKKLLILRPDNLGDCILFSGSLSIYRRLYKEYKISLALKKHIIPLFEGNENIDELLDYKIFSYTKISKYKILRVFEFLLKYLRIFPQKLINNNWKWDLIICPVRSNKKETLWIINSLNCKNKIGILGCDANYSGKLIDNKNRIFSQYYYITEDEHWQHEITTSLKFLKMQGATIQSEEEIYPSLSLYPSIRKDSSLYDSLADEYITLAPYSLLSNKELNNRIYLEILEKIKNSCQILILGSAKEYQKAEELKEMLLAKNNSVINLCGKTNYQDLIKIIDKAKHVISIDTSILHLSIMLKKKVIAIVGGGQWGRFFPWGNNSNIIWINERMDCYGCNWECKFNDFRCVSNINLELLENKFL